MTTSLPLAFNRKTNTLVIIASVWNGENGKMKGINYSATHQRTHCEISYQTSLMA